MKVTDVRLTPLEFGGPVKALASVTFDDSFVVHRIRVVEGRNGLFISMPSRRDDDGEYQDIAHPVTLEMRRGIQKRVLEAYRGDSGSGNVG